MQTESRLGSRREMHHRWLTFSASLGRNKTFRVLYPPVVVDNGARREALDQFQLSAMKSHNRQTTSFGRIAAEPHFFTSSVGCMGRVQAQAELGIDVYSTKQEAFWLT